MVIIPFIALQMTACNENSNVNPDGTNDSLCIYEGDTLSKIPQKPSEPADSINRKWYLEAIVELDSCEVTEIEPKDWWKGIYIEFTKDDSVINGQIYGKAINNEYWSNYIIEGNNINIEFSGSTDLRSPDLERRYFYLFSNASSYYIHHDKLFLMDSTCLIFNKQGR